MYNTLQRYSPLRDLRLDAACRRGSVFGGGIPPLEGRRLSLCEI